MRAIKDSLEATNVTRMTNIVAGAKFANKESSSNPKREKDNTLEMVEFQRQKKKRQMLIISQIARRDHHVPEWTKMTF
jgi:secreted trypsin-like serine protease